MDRSGGGRADYLESQTRRAAIPFRSRYGGGSAVSYIDAGAVAVNSRGFTLLSEKPPASPAAARIIAAGTTHVFCCDLLIDHIRVNFLRE